MNRLVPHVLAALLIALPTEVPGNDAEIDRLFRWVTASSPGCAVAVSHQGRQVASRAYGLADLEHDVPIGPDTVFDAGSVVKQFVAAATLLLVEDGRLSLSKDVRSYLPELPDYGHTITLDHLMTHTSGVRDWTGLGPLTGRQVDALALTLRQRGLNFTPGEEWSYSNGGYVLLKEIVARASGMTFGEFARTRLFEPLAMTRTAYVADPRTVLKNRALAYEKAATGWRLDIHLDNDRGGGGALFSTPGDLLRWNDALAGGRLGAFVTQQLQEPARLNDGRTLGYARGLFLDTNRGGAVQWHSGGSAGYGTFLARFPEQRLSVATMCNAGEAATGGAYARRIFDLFVPASGGAADDDAPEPSPPGADSSPSADLKARTGLFFDEVTGQPLRLGIEAGKLRVVGGPVLEPVSSNRFRNPRGSLRFMSQDQFELTFVSADRLELTSTEGRTTGYRRAQPYTPTSAELSAFAGRYENDENRVVFDVAPARDGLAVRVSWNTARTFEFRPVDRDTFQMGGMLLRFRRDEGGRPSGMDYSNPIVRNIRFIRSCD